ncbi:MAG: S46 family peptidase [Fimbriimonadaceae bacterium]|nr:S46 family peptidase [Chitinophagales bacterium]
MRKIILVFSFYIATSGFAQEGMWLPILLEQNEAQMQKQGFQLTAKDVYDINNTSMKDAVVLFGGGCTGEVISNEGLVLTNHHCGFSAINAASSVEKNYLRDGFWTYDKKDEIPAPGLSVTFIIRMEDVTDKIIPFLNDAMTSQERSAKINELAAALEKTATTGTHYGAYTRSFYYGNQFYLFVTETFNDIRLVGAPPSSVGSFGGETDNWVWPRHTGDFSLFRIYANKENKPATYSEENIPFKPRYYFPISIKGVEENDFTMVFGFPGKTQEYLTSYAVDLLINTTNPNRIACRDARLDVMDEFMSGNDTVTLMYASKAKGLANAYKKWKGETIGLKANDAITKKKEFENKFRAWSAMSAISNNDADLLIEFEKTYADFKPYSELMDYITEAVFAVEILNYASKFHEIANISKTDTIDNADLQSDADVLLANAGGWFKNYYTPLDKKMFATMLKIYADSISADLQPEYFRQQVIKYNGDFNVWADAVFEKSYLSNYDDVKKLLTNINKKKIKKLLNDPAYKLYNELYTPYEIISKNTIAPYNEKISGMMQQYMEAQMRMQPEKNFYPDANSTLRVTFGNVKGYYPRDGVYYYFATTDDGIERKYINDDEEFDVPDNLLQLFKDDNFGKYADKNGHLPIAFIATNHTTGGNSGSPVLNANGALIGTNFDRVWEGTMSDIMYDYNRCRNISLDVRYTLFIIDKYANAQNIIKELNIVE